MLVSGSVDNTAIVWDIATGHQLHRIKDARHFVQGVAWSPLATQIATQSSDRNFRVYAVKDSKKKAAKTFNCIAAVNKLPKKHEEESEGDDKTKLAERLYVDETKTTFFRRLSYSPCGTLIFTVAGQFARDDGTEGNTVYVYRASHPSVPILRVGSADTPVVAVRCCPILFEKTKDRPADSTDIFQNLPHRIVFAVATVDSVLLYDTEQAAPFALLAHLHLALLTDLAWSRDGRWLALFLAGRLLLHRHVHRGRAGHSRRNGRPAPHPVVRRAP